MQNKIFNLCKQITLTVHWHFIDLGGVVLLDVPENSDVVVLDKVDGHTLAAEST